MLKELLKQGLLKMINPLYLLREFVPIEALNYLLKRFKLLRYIFNYFGIKVNLNDKNEVKRNIFLFLTITIGFSILFKLSPLNFNKITLFISILIYFLIPKPNVRVRQSKIHYLDSIINLKKPENMQLPFVIGCNEGKPVIKDLIEILHLLIAGKTGSGKSITFHSILQSLMLWNQNIEFTMLDFAEVELCRYENFSNCKFIDSEFEEVNKHILFLRNELERRKQLFRENEVVNIKEYNKKSKEELKYLVFAIDEANGFKEDYSKSEFEQIVKPMKVLLKRGRKYGIIILFAVQQTNDTDFCKSWKTQCTRLGHLLEELIDAQNLTYNKEIAQLIPKLGAGEFYLIIPNQAIIPKYKGYFQDKNHNKLFKLLETKYSTVPLKKCSVSSINTEFGTNGTENKNPVNLKKPTDFVPQFKDLSKEEQRKILENETGSLRELGKKYNVSKNTIWRILK